MLFLEAQLFQKKPNAAKKPDLRDANQGNSSKNNTNLS